MKVTIAKTSTSVVTLNKLIGRTPRFMHPQFDRIETFRDLEYQIAMEIDLAESGSVEPRWNKAQFHRAKMFFADVKIAADQFDFEHPELIDDLNHAV